jgi:transketolase
LVLGKGHAFGVLCAALALKGYFPESDLLATLNRLRSPLGTHPEMNKVPGVDMTTDSLGHGLPVAMGMALAGKLADRDYRVFLVADDGERHERLVWEAFTAAAHHGLDNLVVIIDKKSPSTGSPSMGGPTRKTMASEHFVERLRAIGWYVATVEGHDIAQLLEALRDIPGRQGRPTAIIAFTVKGEPR